MMAFQEDDWKGFDEIETEIEVPVVGSHIPNRTLCNPLPCETNGVHGGFTSPRRKVVW